MAAIKNNLRRLLLTLETLADLGNEITSERPFSETAATMLSGVMEAVSAREGALFAFSDRPSMLGSVAVKGFANFPAQVIVPLLPRQVHALNSLRTPAELTPHNVGGFLSSNGNVAPELFRCIAALRVGGKLVGAIGLGRRAEEGNYQEDALHALNMLSSYVGLAVHNHALSQTLQQRVSENLRLMGSLHTFTDKTLQAFAAAIDVKHVHVHGHSVRVGRYTAGLAEALGLEPTEVASLRSAGYLHDIGKVAVDKRLFGKAAALDAEEFREMADHTVVGHEIVSGVEFPFARVPEVVRWHHERSDGSGYPDRLRGEEAPLEARIVGVADTLDAMVSERPYRHSLAVGVALSDIVRMTPQKFDPSVVQALLVQIRRDAVGRASNRFLEGKVVCNIAPGDVDLLASTLNHKLTHGRIYSA